MRFIVLIFLSMVFYACSDEKIKPSVNETLNVEELPSQESWDAVISFSDSGEIQAVLYAGHLRVFPESRVTLLDSGIKVNFYDENEKITTVLTAKRGRVNDATHDLYAIDSVVAVNDSGITIKTQELMWRNKDQKIVSDKFVTILTPTEKIQGYGFESNQGLDNYVIYDITYITRRDSL